MFNISSVSTEAIPIGHWYPFGSSKSPFLRQSALSMHRVFGQVTMGCKCCLFPVRPNMTSCTVGIHLSFQRHRWLLSLHNWAAKKLLTPATQKLQTTHFSICYPPPNSTSHLCYLLLFCKTKPAEIWLGKEKVSFYLNELTGLTNHSEHKAAERAECFLFASRHRYLLS